MRQGKTEQGSDSSLHVYQKKLHSSPENELPGPTWSTPREFPTWFDTQDSPVSDLVHNTRYAHFEEVRCSTHGTGCLPIDMLFQLTRFCIGHSTTVNLERKLRETTCVSGTPTQTRDTEKRACNRRTTREDTTDKYSIVIHIRIDDNREYCISIHFRMYNKH